MTVSGSRQQLLLLLLLHSLAFKSCMAAISVVELAMSSSDTLTVTVMHEEPESTSSMTLKLWKNPDVARPNPNGVSIQTLSLPVVGATTKETLGIPDMQEEELCGYYFLCASATVKDTQDPLQPSQYKCIAQHKNCSEAVDLQWVVSVTGDNTTLSAQPGGNIKVSGFAMSIVNKGDTAMAKRSALNSPEIQAYLVYMKSTPAMTMPAFDLTGETNVMEAVQRDRAQYLPKLEMWKQKWVRLRGWELLLTMTDDTGKALNKDGEMSVDVMKLLAPESFAKKSGLMVFVIDPFSKTNDINRDNNIVFAWINLQGASKGRGRAGCEVVPDVAVAGREALVQMNDANRPAVHRFMVRPGVVEFTAVDEQTVKEREEFAMANERAARLAKLNLCPSGLDDAATDDSLLVKMSKAASALSEPLSMIETALSDVHEGVETLLRLVQNATDHAARMHGPVRWLLLRTLPHLLHWEMSYTSYHHDGPGGYDYDSDMHMEDYDNVVFPDDYYYSVDPGLQEDVDGDDLSKEKYQSRMHDSHDSKTGFERCYDKVYKSYTPDMPPSYRRRNSNPDQARRVFPVLSIARKIYYDMPVRYIEELSVLPRPMLEDLEQVVQLFKSETMFMFTDLLFYHWISGTFLDLWLSITTDLFSGMAPDLDDAVDKLVTFLNTTDLPQQFAMSPNNETMRDAINLVIEYLNVVKNNSDVVTEVLGMITSLWSAPEKLCCMMKQPERAPSQEMVCLRAAQEEVRLMSEHFMVNEEKFFRNAFEDAMRMRRSQAEPLYWSIKDGAVYSIERCPLSGTFMWEQVAICSCPKGKNRKGDESDDDGSGHSGKPEKEGKKKDKGGGNRNGRGNGKGKRRDGGTGRGENEPTSSPEYEVFEIQEEYSPSGNDYEEEEDREPYVFPLRHDDRSPRKIPPHSSTLPHNDYERINPAPYRSRLFFDVSLKNVTVSKREETLVVEGRVQVAGWTRQHGEMVRMNSSVCNDGVWDDGGAKVACRMVFGKVVKEASSHNISSTEDLDEHVPRPLLMRVSCQGDEHNFQECKYRWGKDDCNGEGLAGARCVLPLT